MWIHWSITRLVRWRLRDWASCLTACRFPIGKQVLKSLKHGYIEYSYRHFTENLLLYEFIDDETDTYQSSQHQLPIRNIVFDVKDERTRDRNSKKLLGNKNRCRKINLSSTQVVSAENTSNINESRWPSFADEDYIVFCFREDGAFDIVKDCKSESSNRIDCTKRGAWPVNKMLTCDEDPEKRSNEDCHDIFPISDVEIIPVKEVDDDEEESLYLDTELPSSRIVRREKREWCLLDQMIRISQRTAQALLPFLYWVGNGEGVRHNGRNQRDYA